MRILEINYLGLVKTRYPEQTEHVDTVFTNVRGTSMLSKLRALGAQFARLFVLTFLQRCDLIFCRCMGRYVYRRDVSLPVNLFRLVMGWWIELCVWTQLRRGARLMVVDLLDESTIDHRDLFLLRRCEVYFKRELPQNTWNTFLRVQPGHGEFFDLTGNPAFVPHLRKFAPLSLGISPERIQEIDAVVARHAGTEKRYDVFFAGGVRHSTVRMAGLQQLDELRRRGYRVETLTGYFPYPEFVEKMHASWLVLSPEGQGWDCFRHYEIPVAGSVPLINFPSINRYAPLRDGEHCVQYYIEGDDLCQKVEQALRDKDKLLQMAAAGRAHVLEHHSHHGIGEYLLKRALEVPGPALTRP